MSKRLLLAVVVAYFTAQAGVADDVRVEGVPFDMPVIPVARFEARDFLVTDYGAREGEKATAAFAAAMSACEQAGGGRVIVPAGRWLTGAVRFRSNCNLFLDEGATLEFTDDPADYPEVFTTWEGIECYNHSPLLFAFGVTNVAITGTGTIAPRMDFWRTWFARPPEHMKATEHLYYWCSTNCPIGSRRLLALDRAHMRPHLIQFNRCGKVLLDGFRIRESPFWMIHLYHSENCIIRNLDTIAHGHNNDGVDVDMTKNVLIENCRFDQGDDGIVLKAGRNADAWRLDRCTENVVIRDCDMVQCHALLGIGSELSGGVRNVWMTRCRVGKTGSMLRIKTGPRRGGFVENVWMDHCLGERMIRAFEIFTDYCAQWGRFPDFELRRTRIRNVNFSSCEAGMAVKAVEFRGDALLPPREIRVSDIRIGRVLGTLKEVKNCEDVRIDGLEISPSAVQVDYRPRQFVADGDSIETFESDGSWVSLLRRLEIGDRVEIRFPVSARALEFAEQVKAEGGLPLFAREPARIRVIAHRGLHGPGVAQNSIAAFKAAFDAGAKWIETDFYQLRDGRILCVHDRRELKKISGVDRDISGLSSADVAAIDIGRAAKTAAPVRMPYVEDVLAVVPKDAIAQCEIKLYGPDYADRFDAARRAAGLSETNVLVTSFNLPWLSDFKKRYPRYVTGWLGCGIGGPDFDLCAAIAAAKDAGCAVFCPGAAKAAKAGITPKDADRVRAAGLDFRLYGVNSADQLSYAARLGATAFTCDHWREAFEWARGIPGVELKP